MVPELVDIQIAKATRLAMTPVDSAAMRRGFGVPGDRYEQSRRRPLTVQSRESLDEAAEALGVPVPTGATRRNLTISTGVVPSRPGHRFKIGEVASEVVSPARPCRIMDDAIVPGAYATRRERAGSACRTLTNGTINVADAIDLDGHLARIEPTRHMPGREGTP